MMIASVIGANALGYAFHLITGRLLGPADYGQFGLILSFYMLMSLPFSGFYWAVLRYTSTNKTETTSDIRLILLRLTRIGFILSIVFALILILGKNFWEEYVNISDPFEMLILALTFFGAIMSSLIRGRIHGRRQYKTISWLTVFEGVVRVSMVVTILYFWENIFGAFIAFCCGYIVPALPYSKEFFKDLREGIREERQSKEKIQFSWKYMLLISLKNTVLLGIIELSVLVANQLLEPQELGYWNAAITLGRINIFTANGIISVLFSESTNTSDKSDALVLLKKASKFYLAITLLVAALFFIVPSWFVLPLYGKSFIGATEYLPWIGLGTGFFGLIQILTGYYFSRLSISSSTNK